MTAPIAPPNPNLAGGTVIDVQLLRYDGTAYCLDGQPVEFTCTGDDLLDRLFEHADGWVHQRRDAVNLSQHADLIANGIKFGVSVYHHPLEDAYLAVNRENMVRRLAENVAKAARS